MNLPFILARAAIGILPGAGPYLISRQEAGAPSDSPGPDSSLLTPVDGVMRDVEVGVRGWVEGVSGLGVDSQNNVLLSILAVVLVYSLRRVALRVVERKVQDAKQVYRWSKNSSYAALLFSFILVGTIWLEGLLSLGAFLGLLSAGVAIALRDVVASVAGWAFILWRRPFQLGDRIQLGGRAGDVVDLRPFQFTLLEIGNWVDADQSTGRIIHVPNFLIFSEPLYNYTAQFEFIWQEIPILLTFESDWKKAKAILQEILDERVGETVREAELAMKTASKKFFIYFTRLTPKVYTTVADSGVLLTLRFICRVRQRRGATEEIWEAVLDAFAKEPTIDYAYPTTRMYHNLMEGKEGARADLPPGLRGGRPPDLREGSAPDH